MDPLSDLLSLLKPRTYAASGFDAGGEWSARFGSYEGIKCYAVTSGSCWLALDGGPEPIRLQAGQCFLLSHGRPFRLTNNLALVPSDAMHFFIDAGCRGSIKVINGGGSCIIGGHFTFSGNHLKPLLQMLPPVVHLHESQDKQAMEWSLDRLRQELSFFKPGSALVVEHLVHLMLVQVLRLHIGGGNGDDSGWLRALGDKQLGAAITAMHEEPGKHWNLERLCVRVGMSRSMFAQKFKQKIGTSPMEYLTQWRMLLAGDRLVSSSDSLSDIAHSLGYESENAFSIAFRRVMGSSPHQYRRPKTKKGHDVESSMSLRKDGFESAI